MTQTVYKVPTEIVAKIDALYSKYELEITEQVNRESKGGKYDSAISGEYWTEMNELFTTELMSLEPGYSVSAIRHIAKNKNMPLNQLKVPAVKELMSQNRAFLNAVWEDKRNDFNELGELVVYKDAN